MPLPHDLQDDTLCEHPGCAHYADQQFLGRHLCGEHYTEMLDERLPVDERDEILAYHRRSYAGCN